MKVRDDKSRSCQSNDVLNPIHAENSLYRLFSFIVHFTPDLSLGSGGWSPFRQSFDDYGPRIDCCRWNYRCFQLLDDAGNTLVE